MPTLLIHNIKTDYITLETCLILSAFNLVRFAAQANGKQLREAKVGTELLSFCHPTLTYDTRPHTDTPGRERRIIDVSNGHVGSDTPAPWVKPILGANPGPPV